jgi:indolepyruvate ferredoxin oxidoreductase
MCLPTINENHIGQYVHDLIIFDRGVHLNSFIKEAKILSDFYNASSNQEFLNMAIRTLAKTYFIKDEVFIAHMMISPMRRRSDQENYGTLGKRFKKTFINRPSFDVGSKKLEFDFSPSKWMLKSMRHARFLRQVLPAWHKREREISEFIKRDLLKSPLPYSELKKLENIKGYREVRYEVAELQK